MSPNRRRQTTAPPDRPRHPFPTIARCETEAVATIRADLRQRRAESARADTGHRFGIAPKGRVRAMTARIRRWHIDPRYPRRFRSRAVRRREAAVAVFPRFPETSAPSAISIGIGLAEDRLRLARLPQRPSPIFSAAFGFASRSIKKDVAGRLPLRSSPSGAGSIVPGFTTPIEIAMERPDRKRNTTMATISTFTKNEIDIVSTPLTPFPRWTIVSTSQIQERYSCK